MSLRDYVEYKELTERIGEAIRSDRLSHAYIIEGDSLSHREGFAVDIAKALLCQTEHGVGCDNCSICRRIAHGNYQDLYVVESDNRSVKDKDIFQLQLDLMNVPTGEGDRNIAIVPDADTMTVRAQNRFLKTLEEPPVGTLIMLLVENSEKLLPTIRSRCQTIRLYSEVQNPDDELTGIAKNLMGMIKRSYHFEIKAKLDESIKDRKTAERFLDALEHFARASMLRETDAITFEDAVKAIPFVEQARKDIKINVNYKYALGDLFLKLAE